MVGYLKPQSPEFIQQLLQEYRLVMFLIGCAVQERDGPMTRQPREFFQHRPLIGIHEFRAIALTKPDPLGMIMSKPLPQRSARRQLFSPCVDARPFLGEASGPHTINQNSDAIAYAWFAVHTFNPYHGAFCSCIDPDCVSGASCLEANAHTYTQTYPCP